MIEVCSFYGIALASADIEAVYRVSNSKSDMMIAKFTKFEHKMKLMSAKGKKFITIGDIPSVTCNSGGQSKQIFINSHVTPTIGRMLHRGRLAVKDKQIAACWVTGNCLNQYRLNLCRSSANYWAKICQPSLS